uniref:Nudix hydrolase domain-containing protein n=1 Tax=Aureoumbra lagunensis TaxID=44058 RepID=A0A7S3K4D1_9STRA
MSLMIFLFMCAENVLSLHIPNFCPHCGSDRIISKVPQGDERMRAVCKDCHTIHYENPKVVVACVVRDTELRYILGKRSIEPRIQTWGFPQGFMELNETTRDCAARETIEEIGIVIDPSKLSLLAIYNLPKQVQIVYEAKIDSQSAEKHAQSTKECSEINLFHIDNLPPENEIAFPTVIWALHHAHHRRDISHVQQRTKLYDGKTWKVITDDDIIENA